MKRVTTEIHCDDQEFKLTAAALCEERNYKLVLQPPGCELHSNNDKNNRDLRCLENLRGDATNINFLHSLCYSIPGNLCFL